MSVKNSRKTTVMLGVIGCLLLALAVGTGIAIAASEARRSPGIRYVKESESGSGDCTDWDNACTLQTALGDAGTGDEIWVAEGTHKPTTGTDRTETFQLKSGVGVYGGFAGTETSRDERDWTLHETILSGDIGTVGDDSDNSYHVVTGSGTDPTAILDGFTITGGYADGSEPHDRGGGMRNPSAGSPTVANVVFTDNYAEYGAGMSNTESGDPMLTNVTFSGNGALESGGGMYNYDSDPTLTDVTFSDNGANFGGGMYNHGCSPALTNVTFSGNLAQGGGGMYSEYHSSPTLTNVTFSGNSAQLDGGGMYNVDYSSPALVNVVLSGNAAEWPGMPYATDGGGMYNEDHSSPTLVNVILWGNTATNGAQIYNEDTSCTPAISYSLVQDCGGSGPGWDATLGTDGNGNIDADPLFVDADGPDDTVGTLDDDLRLLYPSPAMDAGDNTAVPADTLDLDEDGNTAESLPVDLDWNPRFVDIPGVPDTGVGSPPIVDMGAYEAAIGPLHIYVDIDAAGANNGTSWGDAFIDLQDALACAVDGTEIWVAEGTYKPTTVIDRTATFTLTSGVAVYGGFTGTETSLDERDWALHETILSGDIGTVGDRSDNSYHVVTGSGTDATAVLDGFTITGGNAEGLSDNLGGGMYNYSGSPTLANITFTDNWADGAGGMHNDYYSSPTLTDVTFRCNFAWQAAGGMLNRFESSPTLTNVIFYCNNTLLMGGGMVNSDSNPTLTNVIFVQNEGTVQGGGIYNENSDPTLTNVIFSGNHANYGGGMFNTEFSNPTLTNVTFSANQGSLEGGGMSSESHSFPALGNCILWGNTALDGAQLYNDGFSTATISYSLVQDCGGSGPGWDTTLGTDGGGNIDADPLFVDADHDNLRLWVSSPAIDAGDNSAVPADTLDLDEDGNTAEPLPIDLDWNPRFVDLPSVPDTGVGPAPIVDMGAYETLRYLIFPLVFKSYAP